MFAEPRAQNREGREHPPPCAVSVAPSSVATTASGVPPSQRLSRRVGCHGPGSFAGWGVDGPGTPEWVSQGGGAKGVPNSGLVLDEATWPGPQTGSVRSWTLATQWCPHPLSSEGAFLFLPQVFHKGDHAHPRRGVPKPYLSARSPPRRRDPTWALPSVSGAAPGALETGLRTHMESQREPLFPRSVNSVLLPLCWNELWARRGEESAMTACLRLKLGGGGPGPGVGSGFRLPEYRRDPELSGEVALPWGGELPPACTSEIPYSPAWAASINWGESLELLGQKVTVPFFFLE